MKTKISYCFPEDGSPYVKSLLELVEGIISASNKGDKCISVKDIEGFLNCHLVTCSLILDGVMVSLINSSLLTIDENKKCVMEIKEESSF